MSKLPLLAAGACLMLSTMDTSLSSAQALGSPEQFVSAVVPGSAESGTFDYNAAVATRLRDKSVVVATVLDNLTTRRADPNWERVVLSGMTNAPFSGGVNITENSTVTTYAFLGRLTVLDRRAIVELEYTPPGKNDSVLLRAVVPEEGEVLISEIELPPIAK
jgi:hypothetical protein